jgi:hypothetical protein
MRIIANSNWGNLAPDGSLWLEIVIDLNLQNCCCDAPIYLPNRCTSDVNPPNNFLDT